jgi:hypothetical protein
MYLVRLRVVSKIVNITHISIVVTIIISPVFFLFFLFFVVVGIGVVVHPIPTTVTTMQTDIRTYTAYSLYTNRIHKRVFL